MSFTGLQACNFIKPKLLLLFPMILTTDQIEKNLQQDIDTLKINILVIFYTFLEHTQVSVE